MKSIEEKAKAYDEALERAQEAATKGMVSWNFVNEVFYGQRESEDERIRKEIITYLSTVEDKELIPYESWIAWLEKQGEKDEEILILKDQIVSLHAAIKAIKETHRIELEKQGGKKPTDKVEPKFKVGDFVIYNRFGKNKLYNIVKINERGYYVNMDDVPNGILDFKDEVFMHLWTIQDAKDGDVLADGNLPFIIKKIDANKYSYAYCGISVDSGFKIESDGESGEWTWMQDIKPATKEQRDTLLAKMHEAGYEWDAEKKELKEIEQRPDSGGFWEGYNLAKRKFEQKPVWSKEDEAFYQRLEQIVFKVDIEAFQGDRDLHSWLKSLKPRSRWKPSEEQIKVLGTVNITGCITEPHEGEVMISLYNDLKKLTE